MNLNIFSAIIYCAGAGNLLNAILDPILIFLLGLGIGGAAIATVIAEYVSFDKNVHNCFLHACISFILARRKNCHVIAGFTVYIFFQSLFSSDM